ncbi:MAG: STAS domain-containing protein [Betaproteobacteria bacterium]|nr:STAS domain-containing protein [Betaproteobacteria bacterium]
MSGRFASFSPHLLGSLKGYNTGRLVSDVSAGVTVGVVALPLAMAFAIASGLKPEAGIITAIVAGFLISALGGSAVQIGGPAGAFIVIVYGIVERHGVANLLLSTMFAGVILFALGLLRVGNLVRLIPVPIVIGFTNGIAVLIGLSQAKDFLGLSAENLPADFFAKLQALWHARDTLDPATLLLSLACLALVVLWPKTYAQSRSLPYRVLSRVPGTIVVLVAGTLAVTLLHLDVATIGSRFGGIPGALPSFALPEFEWGTVKQLFAPTLTIAMLGAIESLLCARVADSMTQDRHDPNQELMAQGVANFAAPLFGGFCATGTIARTMTNVRCGATSPVAGMVHALVVLVIVLVAAPLAANIPLAALAAILLFVAYNMGEWHEFARLKNFSNNYRAILLTTFVLTVAVDLTVAVEVGLALACLFFITRVSSLTRVEPIEESEEDLEGLPHRSVEAFRINGSLFFGSVSKLEGLLDPKRERPEFTVLEMSGLLNLDTTGVEALRTLHGLIEKRGGRLILCGLQPQPASLIARAGLAAVLGNQNLLETMADARRVVQSSQ